MQLVSEVMSRNARFVALADLALDAGADPGRVEQVVQKVVQQVSSPDGGAGTDVDGRKPPSKPANSV